MQAMWPSALDLVDLPEVPRDLVRYTCGHEDLEEYVRSGYEVASMMNLALLKHTGHLLTEVGDVLDFGCGTGRVTRQLQPRGSVSGCDVNSEVVAYCRAAIPSAAFTQNALWPPLAYADESFDVVCSFSVFSHLREDAERAWLAELARVGRPGCVYLLTVQGDWMIEATLGEERSAAEAAGFYYRQVHQRHGSSLDFPDYYESSYHTSDWIRRHWDLEVLDVIKGDDPGRYLSGDLAFEPHGTVPLLRPMGQDLVVARRPEAAGAGQGALVP